MKLFLKKLGAFFILLLIILIAGILLPTTPRTSANFLFAQAKKDSLLKETPSPRIIFVGGSNLSFGLNSQLIYDSLHINPINTAIHGNLGLVYMMEHTLPFIKQDDIVILSPEYHQFYGNMADGSEELLRTLVEVSPKEIKNIDGQQFINIMSELPKYAFSKFKPSEYFTRPDLTGIYSVNSFNKYGDAYIHWGQQSQTVNPDQPIKQSLNKEVIKNLKRFEEHLKAKKALLYITFPCYGATSYANNEMQIAKLYDEIKSEGFNVISSPQEYKMPDSLIFNTNYHLTKQGVDIRTRLLIHDIKQIKTSQ